MVRAPRQLRGARLLALAVGALTLVAVALLVLRPGSAAHRLDIVAPGPGSALVPEAVDSLAPSVLSVPVAVDLGPLVHAVESALPRAWGDLEDRMAVPEHDRLHVAVAVERDPVVAAFQDTVATLATILSYRARAWYDPPLLPEVSVGCGVGEGEEAPRVAVTLVSPLTLDRDWRLRSRVRAGSIVPVSEEDRDRCRVTPLRFDVTDRVLTAARELVEQHGPDADRALGEVDVRDSFAHWWRTIAEPIRLSDDVWLVLSPEAVARGPILGSGEVVATTLALTARPRVVVGERPPVLPRDLPPLDTAASGGPLTVRAEARADYGEIAQRVRDATGERRFEAEGRSVHVRSVEAWGVGDGRLVLAVEVDGDVEGTLYLVGTPSFHPGDGHVSVPDLDFDVASREALVSGAAFLARVGLVGHVRELARWPTDAVVAWAREQVEKGFNTRLSDEVRLQGAVDSVRILGIVADTGSLRVRAEVRGSVTLLVEDRAGAPAP